KSGDAGVVKTVDPQSRSHSATPCGNGATAQFSTAHVVVETNTSRLTAEPASLLITSNPLDQSNAALMGDAPACDGCGSITVRNGSCYKCMNCGNSMGCS